MKRVIEKAKENIGKKIDGFDFRQNMRKLEDRQDSLGSFTVFLKGNTWFKHIYMQLEVFEDRMEVALSPTERKRPFFNTTIEFPADINEIDDKLTFIIRSVSGNDVAPFWYQTVYKHKSDYHFEGYEFLEIIANSSKEEPEEDDVNELEEAVTKATAGFGEPIKLRTPIVDMAEEMGILKNEEE